ncbi:MAG: hypothetical protein QXI93_01220 [Candidatus Methanomethylicia archaeon]
MSEAKFIVDIKRLDKVQRVPQEVIEEIKGAIGGKMLSNMRKEIVQCPITNRETPFLICFSCKNFIRRIHGKVHCRGFPIN